MKYKTARRKQKGTRKTLRRKTVRRKRTRKYSSRLSNVSSYLRKAFPVLRKIARDPHLESRRRRLLKASKRKDICFGLKELALNKLRGNLEMGNKSGTPSSNDLIRLIASTKDRRNLESLTTQSGGILPFLIPAAAATLGGLLKNVLF